MAERVPEIQLGRCLLREWRHGDEPSLVRCADNRKIWDNVRDAFPHPYTRESAREWISTGSRRERTLNFAIVAGGEAVGGIGLIFGTDVYRRCAEIGYWLGEEYWGQGIMTETVKAVVEYALGHFDLCRIYAAVFESNNASRRVLEKAGFTLEARLKKHVTKNGKTFDELIYSLVTGA